MTQFYFHTDAGHGWLGVTTEDVKDVGLTPAMFSSCSYIRGDVLYLEEDCDAGLFIKAYRAKHGVDPEYIERHVNGDHAIRSYKHLTGSDYSWELMLSRMKHYDSIINKAA
jgi:hypothetical protein